MKTIFNEIKTWFFLVEIRKTVKCIEKLELDLKKIILIRKKLKMEKLNLKEDLQVDKKLEKIWSDRYKENVDIIAPLYKFDAIKNAVTFLSLNPSLQPKDRNNAHRGHYPNEKPYIIDINSPKAEYPFFQKFYDLGNELKETWTTLDLLFERESNQEEIQNKYNPKIINDLDKTFLQNQIKLTFEILENIKPKVVVVSNAWTDKLIHSNLDDLKYIQEFPSDENKNIYKINNIPFITNESRFLGSRQHFISSKKDGRFENLVNEIKRVSNTK